MVILTTLSSPIELEMLKELFEENGIDIVVKHREAGEFLTIYMGTSTYGIDIFVKEEDELKARELYDLYFSEMQPIDEETLAKAAEEAVETNDSDSDEIL